MHTQHVIQLVMFLVGLALVIGMAMWLHHLDDPMYGSPDGAIAQAYVSLFLVAVGALLMAIASVWFVIGGILGL